MAMVKSSSTSTSISTSSTSNPFASIDMNVPKRKNIVHAASTSSCCSSASFAADDDVIMEFDDTLSQASTVKAGTRVLSSSSLSTTTTASSSSSSSSSRRKNKISQPKYQTRDRFHPKYDQQQQQEEEKKNSKKKEEEDMLISMIKSGRILCYIKSLKKEIKTLEKEKKSLQRQCEKLERECIRKDTLNRIIQNSTKEYQQQQQQQQQRQRQQQETSSIAKLKSERDGLRELCLTQLKAITTLEKNSSHEQMVQFATGEFKSTRQMYEGEEKEEEENEPQDEEKKEDDSVMKLLSKKTSSTKEDSSYLNHNNNDDIDNVNVLSKLQDAKAALELTVKDQAETIHQLTNENTMLHSKIGSLTVDLESSQKCCETLSNSIGQLTLQKNDYRQQVEELQGTVQSQILVNQTQAISMECMQKELIKNKQESQVAWNQMTSKLELYEDENERLLAKCTAFQYSIDQLVQEKKNNNNNNNNNSCSVRVGNVDDNDTTVTMPKTRHSLSFPSLSKTSSSSSTTGTTSPEKFDLSLFKMRGFGNPLFVMKPPPAARAAAVGGEEESNLTQ